MLIVHPSSTCDVCLDGYSWATPANTPHAIACGHVFCLQCLNSTHPAQCPLCRRAFKPDQIRKLHVDRSTIPSDQNLFTASEESELIRRLSLFFDGDKSRSDDANAVIDEVHEWLAARPGEPAKHHRQLRAVVAALQHYRVIQQQSIEDREALTNLRTEHFRRLHIKDHDLSTARAVEIRLLEQIEQMETELKGKLAQAEADLAATQATLQSYRRADYQAIRNVMPRPPQPIPYESLYRPQTPTSNSKTSFLERVIPGDYSNRQKTDGSNPPIVPLASMPDKGGLWFPEGAHRPSLIQPGAPSDHSVVPLDPSSRSRERRERQVVYPIQATPQTIPAPAAETTTARSSRRSSISGRIYRDNHQISSHDDGGHQRAEHPSYTAARDAVRSIYSDQASSNGVRGGPFANEQAAQGSSNHIYASGSVEALFGGRTPNENLDGLSLLTPPLSRQSGRREPSANAQRDMASILELSTQTLQFPSALSRETSHSGETSAGGSGSREGHAEFRDLWHDRAPVRPGADADSTTAPRTRTSSHGIATRSTGDPTRGGLGVTLGSGPVGGHSAVPGQLDLHALDHSLRQLSTQQEQRPEHTTRQTAPEPLADSHVGARSGLPLYRSRSFGPSSSTQAAGAGDVLPDAGLFLPSLRDEIAVLRSHNEEAERASRTQASRDPRSGVSLWQSPESGIRPRRTSQSVPFIASTAIADPGHDRSSNPSSQSHPRHTFEVATQRRENVPMSTKLGIRRSPREPVLPSISTVISANNANSSASVSTATVQPSSPLLPTNPSGSVVVPITPNGSPSDYHHPYPMSTKMPGIRFMPWPASRSSR